METNIVTQRFVKCHNYLKDARIVKSSRQFALDLDYLPQSLSEILNGRRDVTIELLRKAIEVFHFNPAFIFTGEGEMLHQQQIPKSYQQLSEEQIIHVPIPAQAQYAAQCLLEKAEQHPFMSNLPILTLPDYKYGTGNHRSFDVY